MLCGELIMTDKFDFNEALKAIQSGQAISGKDGVLAPLLKQLTEAALEAELDSHLADDVVPIARTVNPVRGLKPAKERLTWIRPGIVLVPSTLNLSKNTKPVSAMRSSQRSFRCMVEV